MTAPKRRRTPARGTGTEWSDTVTSGGGAETAPTQATDGIDVTGWSDLVLTLAMTAITAYTVQIYTWDGEAWVQSEDDKITETAGTSGLVRTYDVGAHTRVAVRITAITGTSITRKLRAA